MRIHPADMAQQQQPSSSATVITSSAKQPCLLLNALPQHVLAYLISFVASEHEDLLQLRPVSTTMQRLIDTSPYVWAGVRFVVPNVPSLRPGATIPPSLVAFEKHAALAMRPGADDAAASAAHALFVLAWRRFCAVLHTKVVGSHSGSYSSSGSSGFSTESPLLSLSPLADGSGTTSASAASQMLNIRELATTALDRLAIALVPDTRHTAAKRGEQLLPLWVELASRLWQCFVFLGAVSWRVVVWVGCTCVTPPVSCGRALSWMCMTVASGEMPQSMYCFLRVFTVRFLTPSVYVLQRPGCIALLRALVTDAVHQGWRRGCHCQPCCRQRAAPRPPAHSCSCD